MIEKAHDGQHFSQTFGVESEPLHGGRMRINSIRTAVSDRYCQSNDLLGQQVDLGALPTGVAVTRLPGNAGVTRVRAWE